MNENEERKIEEVVEAWNGLTWLQKTAYIAMIPLGGIAFVSCTWWMVWWCFR